MFRSIVHHHRNKDPGGIGRRLCLEENAHVLSDCRPCCRLSFWHWCSDPQGLMPLDESSTTILHPHSSRWSGTRCRGARGPQATSAVASMKGIVEIRRSLSEHAFLPKFPTREQAV